MRRSLAGQCGRAREERSVARRQSRLPVRAVAALLVACALTLTLGPAQAVAAPKGVVGFFGSAGAGAGQFNQPRGIAVNETTGDVYVVDGNNHRVQQFDRFGTFLRAWGWGVRTGAAAFEVCNAPGPCLAGGLGANAGQFNGPQGIAIDQVTGDVYVTNQNNRRIEKFDSSGNFLFAFGWGVDTGAAAVETCTLASTCQAAVSGPNAGQFAGQAPNNFTGYVAVDPRNGDVVVADPGNRRVQRFDSSGAFLFAFGWGVDTGAAALQTCTTASTCQAGVAGSGAGQFATNQPTRVAVDSTGSIYTAEPGANFRVQKFNPSATGAGVFASAVASGTNSGTAPSDIAVDRTNDNVLATKPDSSTGTTERRVLELNFAGSLVDTHAAGAGLPAANGLALRGSTGQIYFSTTTNQRVFVIGAITPPSVTMGAVDVMGTSATFNGTVNPNGAALQTSYRFEYREEGATTWARVPASDVPVPNGTADVPVSQPVTDLEPNTQYRVRLVASRPFAGGSATSTEQTFTISPARPSITDVGAREVTDTMALLAGRVDPNRSHTTYRFEYGTDTSYGNATAVDNAGSGAASVPVSKAISGLQPNTTYHFRLVATNATGETAGADHTFTTAAAPPQPSGRAYEMVSPLDKNGGDIERDLLCLCLTNQSGASLSGNAVAFTSRAQFADIESGALEPTYVARREEAGWRTEGITPPITNVDPAGPEAPAVTGLSLDLSKAFVTAQTSLASGADRLSGSSGLYMRTSGQAEPYTLLSLPWTTLPLDTDSGNKFYRFEFVDDTPDSRHVVFNSERQLLEDGPSGVSSNPRAVYEWVDGSLRLVSVPPRPDVQQFDLAQPIVAGARERGESTARLTGDNVLSDDGRRVFFTANMPGGGRHLFVREDGRTTVHVSRSQRPEDPEFVAAQVIFLGAKGSDGSVAFFTAERPLTQGAATARSLYRWDADPPAGQPPLTEVSRAPAGQPGIFEQMRAAVSDDGTSVAFIAEGLLDPDTTAEIPGEPNLYLWREGEGVHYVATLDETRDSISGTNPSASAGGRPLRISADGERVLFASFAPPKPPTEGAPAYDTTEETPEACGDPSSGGDPCRQIYLYDAPSEKVSCITCVPGVALSGNANLFGDLADEVDAPYREPRNLSADGARAFFETARALVSVDRNTALDVYQWADPDRDGQGELSLVSPGRGAFDSKFLDASASGDDVFFTTREQLVGIDNDNLVDLYDARVGGGLAAQNPPPVSSCQGDECQGARSGAPLLPGVASGGTSNGDARPGRRASFSVARLSRRQLTRLARGRAVPVRVRVSRPGKVTLRARAKLGKRMVTVAGASKRARKAGTVTLQLKLARSARRALARKGRMNVRLAVRFTGVREARTSMLRLRRASSTGERGTG
jgi:hypothetical protein